MFDKIDTMRFMRLTYHFLGLSRVRIDSVQDVTEHIATVISGNSFDAEMDLIKMCKADQNHKKSKARKDRQSRQPSSAKGRGKGHKGKASSSSGPMKLIVVISGHKHIECVRVWVLFFHTLSKGSASFDKQGAASFN